MQVKIEIVYREGYCEADGNDHGTVIDLVDDFGMLKGWAKKRKNIYRKLGYEIG